MTICPRPRRSCGSVSDIKIICNDCGRKMFVARSQLHDPDGKELAISCIHPGCAGYQKIDLSEDREWYGTEPVSHMFDLVYAKYGGDAMEELRREYPGAHFKDGSDYIHPERFTIDIDGVTRKDYYLFLVRTGIAAVSMNFQLDLRMPHRRDLMLEIAREMGKT